MASLRRIVDAAAPDASSTIKWAQPVWESDGPFAYVKAFERSVNIGFWRGAELDDPTGILEGEGERMKHLTLREGDAIPADELSALVRQAIALNRELGKSGADPVGPGRVALREERAAIRRGRRDARRVARAASDLRGRARRAGHGPCHLRM